MYPGMLPGPFVMYLHVSVLGEVVRSSNRNVNCMIIAVSIAGCDLCMPRLFAQAAFSFAFRILGGPSTLAMVLVTMPASQASVVTSYIRCTFGCTE